jgi:D-alanine-D-alanine ligase
MDKAKAKAVMKTAGIPVAEHKVIHRLEAAREHVLKPPYVAKPVCEGSSFGVLIVQENAAHPPQELFRDDWAHGDMVMVERYIPGRDLTCAVMGDVALGVTEMVPVGHSFYDFDAKYAPGGSQHILPAEISPFVYQEVQKLSLKAHRALGCKGVTRADFRFDEQPTGGGELICLEVNTQPGMTETSLVPEIAAHAGHSFEELTSWMVENASCGR